MTRVLAAAGWLLLTTAGIAALCWAISRADDWLDRRQLARAVIREAEHHTRTAAARTEEGTP